MEYFAIAEAAADEARLQHELTVASLPRFCDSIDQVLEDHGDHGEIYCLWGQFEVHREAINGGVRFTLPHCPNALAWTVIAGFPPAPDKVVVHCTIARTEHDPDFLETIEAFVEDWRAGLERGLAGA